MYLTDLYRATYRFSYAIIFAKPAFAFLSLLPFSFVSMCFMSPLNSIIPLPTLFLSSISEFPSFSSFFLCLYLALNIFFSIFSFELCTFLFHFPVICLNISRINFLRHSSLLIRNSSARSSVSL